MYKFIFISFILVCANAVHGQETNEEILVDTTLAIGADSLEEEIKQKFFKRLMDKTYPNPLRAAAMSLVLPGSGQIYNKRYWKAPIIYGGLVGMGLLIQNNNKNYKTFNEAYLLRVDDDPDTVDQFPNAAESTLLGLRNRYDKRKQQSYVGFVLIWFLNSVDAFVDAHLLSFDINDDLSLNVNPNLEINNGVDFYGLGLSIDLKKNKEPKSLISP